MVPASRPRKRPAPESFLEESSAPLGLTQRPVSKGAGNSKVSKKNLCGRGHHSLLGSVSLAAEKASSRGLLKTTIGEQLDTEVLGGHADQRLKGNRLPQAPHHEQLDTCMRFLQLRYHHDGESLPDRFHFEEVPSLHRGPFLLTSVKDNKT